jgi:hypothetical protein
MRDVAISLIVLLRISNSAEMAPWSVGGAP